MADEYDALEDVTNRLCGKEPREIYQELGVLSRNDLSITPWEAFLQLKESWEPRQE